MNTQLSLAPLAYYWSKAETLAFYRDVMAWPLDIVYLGEVVCARRNTMQLEDWLAIAEDLQAAGKQVVLSGLPLLESARERSAMSRLVYHAKKRGCLVEINDFSMINAMEHAPFIAGPHLQISHRDMLNQLHASGAIRFVASWDIRKQVLAQYQQMKAPALQTELCVWGRPEPTYPAHCLTGVSAMHTHSQAPHFESHCEYRCELYPNGLPLATREHAPILHLNKLQAQGMKCLDLSTQLPEIFSLQVDVLRLQPQLHGMAAVVQGFDFARQRKTQAHIADHCLPAFAERSHGAWYEHLDVKTQNQTIEEDAFVACSS